MKRREEKRGELFEEKKKKKNGRNWENIIYGGKDGILLELFFF